MKRATSKTCKIPRNTATFRQACRVALFAFLFFLTTSIAPAHAQQPVIDVNAVKQWITQLINDITLINGQITTNFLAIPAAADAQAGASIGSAQVLGGKNGAIPTAATGIMDSHRQDTLMQRAMVRQGDATLAPNSLVCPTINVYQSMDAVQVAKDGVKNALHQLGLKRGQGAQANAGVYREEVSKDLCTLGMIDSPSYPNCSPDSNYRNAPINPGSVTASLQYPLPANVTVKPDGFLSFAGASEDEKAWVAAYRYCEIKGGLPVPGPIPSSGGKLMENQSGQAWENWTGTGNIEGFRSQCIEMVMERTACPSASVGVAGGTTCHDAQVNLCKSLKSAPNSNPGGWGITGNPLLDNCETTGLSLKEAEYIMASKCGNKGYVETAAAGSTASAEELEKHTRNECQQSLREFNNALAAEKSSFQASLNALGTAPQLTATNPGGVQVK